MMVIDPMVSKNSAQTELDSEGPKKPLKRKESSKRASESLKRNTAKELRSRSKSPSGLGGRTRTTDAPTRKLSRKKSSNKDAKKDKKKKKKESSSDKSDNSDASSDATPITVNSNLPLDTSSTHSKSSKKTPKRSRSSKGVKKALRDSSTTSVSEHMKNNNELSGGSEHTQSTKTSDSTASTKDTSAKGILSKVKLKKKEKESEDMRSKPQPSIASPRNRTLSFESINGKSFHKPKTRRTQGNAESAGKFIATLAPPPPSPQPQHAVFGSPMTPGTKKKSVLKAKREKQEQERRASLEKKKSEEYIQEVLAVVNSTPKTNRKSIDGPSSEENFVDPDECSSQSSSCSVVSDGSYEKDDLLSQASDRSVDLDPRFSLSNDKHFFGDHAITIDDDHELSPTKVSPRKALPDEMFSPEDSSTKKDTLSDSLMEAMASSMSALTEVDEEDSPMPSQEASARRKVPRKPLLKNIPESAPVAPGKGRRMPKRATSDITALNRMRTTSFEIRLPGQRKPVTRQRSLTFNEKVRVKRIPCQAQIVGGDTSELWFQPQEYDAIKRKTMALIRAVQDDRTGGVTYCTRGLERYFSVDAVQEKRNDAWDSVLDEQEAQRSNHEEFNAERLSWAYSQTTRNSVKEAMERGKLDQDAIARYTKKMRQTLRRTYSNAV